MHWQQMHSLFLKITGSHLSLYQTESSVLEFSPSCPSIDTIGEQTWQPHTLSVIKNANPAWLVLVRASIYPFNLKHRLSSLLQQGVGHLFLYHTYNTEDRTE